MKGQIISEEFNKMVWVEDKDGAQYACYANHTDGVTRKEELTNEEQQRCMNLNEVLGDSW